MLPRFSASGVATHLYARSREAMIVEEVAASAQSAAQSRSATFTFSVQTSRAGVGDHRT